MALLIVLTVGGTAVGGPIGFVIGLAIWLVFVR